MLRRGAQVLARFGARSISTSRTGLEEAAVAAGPKEFAELWNKTAPSTLAVPETTSSFLPEAPPAVEGDKFPVNFYTPHGVISDGAQKEEVLLPGQSGYFGVKANHVPIIAQLKPGVVELHSGTDVEKYFVSGGFAFVHPGGTTDICVLEAATLDQFDVTAVKQALAASQQDKGGDDYDAAVGRAAVEVYSALDAALEGAK
jgi:F-type H+-transporting ATPase subunit delta